MFKAAVWRQSETNHWTQSDHHLDPTLLHTAVTQPDVSKTARAARFEGWPHSTAAPFSDVICSPIDTLPLWRVTAWAELGLLFSYCAA